VKHYKLIVDEQAALDRHWLDSLLAIGDEHLLFGLSKELFTVLGPQHERLEQYRSVYEKIPFNPDLRPQGIDISQLAVPMKKLRSLKRQILATEESQAIRQAYVGKIDETLLQNELMIAAVNHDAAGFDAANRALYGAPDPRIFAAECTWLRQYARGHAGSENPNIAAAAQALLDTVPKVRGSPKRIIPRNNVFQRVRTLHAAQDGYFDQLFGDIVLPEFVNAAIGDPIVRNALEAIGCEYALVDSSDELWGVIHSDKLVVRPPDYNLPLGEFKGIVAHEIGSHLVERMNGRRQPMRLLEIGLDRYDWSNEGRAFMREQIIFSSPYDMLRQPGWEYIVLTHMAISLGVGLSGAPHTFKELYDAMFPVCRFFQTLRRPDNPVYAESIARSEVWHLLVRVLKGTDGFGSAFMKDIVYLEGNVHVWDLAARDPGYMLFGDQGKFDICRADHRRILAALGIRPVRRSPGKLRARLTLRRSS